MQAGSSKLFEADLWRFREGASPRSSELVGDGVSEDSESAAATAAAAAAAAAVAVTAVPAAAPGWLRAPRSV